MSAGREITGHSPLLCKSREKLANATSQGYSQTREPVSECLSVPTALLDLNTFAGSLTCRTPRANALDEQWRAWTMFQHLCLHLECNNSLLQPEAESGFLKMSEFNSLCVKGP